MIGKVMLGEWLPDLPFYDNPGLTEAKNCLPVTGGYGEFLSLSARSNALSETARGAVATITDSGTAEVYVGTTTTLQQLSGTNWTDRSGATYATAANGYWRFDQFQTLVLATNGVDAIQSRAMGSPNDFADLAAAAPIAKTLGVINNFVVAGNVDGTPHRIQWCAIGDATSWPTPNTIAARTVQAGAEDLNSANGAVTGVARGQFYGLILQERGITRATYVAGDLVFQFEEIENSRGAWAPNGWVQIGRLVYFVAHDGLYVTDGQSVTPIGYGKFDSWFLSEVDMNYRYKITVAVDYEKKCIYWSFPAIAANGEPNMVLVYNFLTNRASWAEQSAQLLFNSLTTGLTLEQLDDLFDSLEDVPVSLDSLQWVGGVPLVGGFSGNALAAFTGDALTARFESGEQSSDEGGLTLILGIRPLVTGSPVRVSMALAMRDYQDGEERTFSAPTTRTLRTGLCDFLQQGRFVSVQMDIEGGFDRAMGFAFIAQAGDSI